MTRAERLAAAATGRMVDDLDEVEAETLTLLRMSYAHDGLAGTEVLWLVNAILDLIHDLRGVR